MVIRNTHDSTKGILSNHIENSYGPFGHATVRVGSEYQEEVKGEAVSADSDNDPPLSIGAEIFQR